MGKAFCGEHADALGCSECSAERLTCGGFSPDDIEQGSDRLSENGEAFTAGYQKGFEEVASLDLDRLLDQRDVQTGARIVESHLDVIVSAPDCHGDVICSLSGLQKIEHVCHFLAVDCSNDVTVLEACFLFGCICLDMSYDCFLIREESERSVLGMDNECPAVCFY